MGCRRKDVTKSPSARVSGEPALGLTAVLSSILTDAMIPQRDRRTFDDALFQSAGGIIMR